MKPYIHAKNSAKKFGGSYLDYLPIHNEMDSSKAALPDVRHRVIYHTSFGIYIIEKIFGEVITNSDGKEVSVRDIAEQHVMEDLGFIPTLENYLQNMRVQEWMIRPAIRKQFERKSQGHESTIIDRHGAVEMPEEKKSVFVSPEISTKIVDDSEVKEPRTGQEVLDKLREEGRLVEDKLDSQTSRRKKPSRRKNKPSSFPFGGHSSIRLD